MNIFVSTQLLYILLYCIVLYIYIKILSDLFSSDDNIKLTTDTSSEDKQKASAIHIQLGKKT